MKVLIDTYRCLMQNMGANNTYTTDGFSLNRYISLLNAEHSGIAITHQSPS